MYFLAQIDLSAGRTPDELGPLRDAEDDAVRALVTRGSVVSPFMRGDRPGAIFVMHGPDEAKVRTDIASLPAIAAGIIHLAELIPLTPHAAHPDHAR